MQNTITIPKELYDRLVSVVDNVVCMELCQCEDGPECMLCSAQRLQVDLMDFTQKNG